MTTYYGVDFGTGAALAVVGPIGPVSKKSLKLPRVVGGRTPAMEFPMVLQALMFGSADLSPGHVVVESATIGSSGCEIDDILGLLQNPENPSHLYTITTRAVKNYRKDHKLPWKKGARYVKDGQEAPQEIELEAQETVHTEDADIIYRIAVEHPERLYRWTGPSEGLTRKHRSVRPMDKRNYQDRRAEMFMLALPDYETLPTELREVLGNGEDYLRSRVMPFAMASTEPHIEDGPKEKRRRRFEKVIGLYDRGYPSYYRRATIVWMQEIAKQLAGVSKIEQVLPSQRKEAWKITQRQIRWFFHLMIEHQEREGLR